MNPIKGTYDTKPNNSIRALVTLLEVTNSDVHTLLSIKTVLNHLLVLNAKGLPSQVQRSARRFARAEFVEQ